MTKVDFQVLYLQVGGSRKIPEVQVRVHVLLLAEAVLFFLTSSEDAVF